MNQKPAASFLSEVLGALLAPKADEVSSLPEDEQTKVKYITTLFTSYVDMLRRPELCPSPRLNALMAKAWDVIGQQHVPCAIGPNVPTLSIAALDERDRFARRMIIIPMDWLEMAAKDPATQVGAVVFVCSSAVDIYNGRVTEDLRRRAMAYEADFLYLVKKSDPTWKPTAYQADVLRTFQMGFPPELLYPMKPVVPKN